MPEAATKRTWICIPFLQLASSVIVEVVLKTVIVVWVPCCTTYLQEIPVSKFNQALYGSGRKIIVDEIIDSLQWPRHDAYVIVIRVHSVNFHQTQSQSRVTLLGMFDLRIWGIAG